MKGLRNALTGSILIASSAIAGVSKGSITAHVVDQNNNPVTGATVWMRLDDGKAHLSPIPDCITEENGSCSRSDLELGRYVVTAMKEPDGYPNIAFALFGHDKQLQIVEIAEDSPATTVRVTLGPKAAAITVDVTDATTGNPVDNPTIKLFPAEKPNAYLTTGTHANSKILIPADEDIVVEVTANGYRTWRVETQPDATHENSLRLHSGEMRNLTVLLQPQ